MKNFVIDTNVLLHNPNAMFAFEENRVIVTTYTIREIDKHKRDPGELGRNARETSRLICELSRCGRLTDGVPLQNGGIFQIPRPQTRSKSRKTKRTDPVGQSCDGVDKLILGEVIRIRDADPTIPTILVTKDTNLSIIAGILGVQAEDYRSDHITTREDEKRTFEIVVDSEKFHNFTRTGQLEIGPGHNVNDYGTLSHVQPGKSKRTTILVKVDESRLHVVPIIDQPREGVYGIRPLNVEQHFVMDALMDDKVNLVLIEGKAGTGKTLLALAAGLERVITGHAFRRMIVARPAVSVGKEIGFLPGTLEEKLGPWMQPIHDALELIVDSNMGTGKRLPDLMRSGSVVVEALSYIRGRSIANQFFILDEAQNLTPLEVKTIVTRIGPGTKLVVTGDPHQIDNPYVDALSNGFSHLVRKFTDQPIAAYVRLLKGERSVLAELAADLL